MRLAVNLEPATASPSSPDDAALVAGVLHGDREIARHLYRQLLPTVERALVRVLGARQTDHEDLVQSSFEQIISSIARDRFSGACSLKTWAATIAARVGFMVLRVRYRQRRLFVSGAEPEEGAGDSRYESRPQAESSLELARVRQAMADLPVRSATVLYLHDVEGYELQEIASMLDGTYAATQSCLVRARKQLAEALAEQATARRTR